MVSGRERFRPVEDVSSQAWKELRLVILARDNYVCQHCGTEVRLGDKSAHVDHIVPRVAGGPTVPENLRTLCRTCNTTKGALEGAKKAFVARAQTPELKHEAEELGFMPTKFHPEPGVWTF
ncbi:HNH endonuclease [Streptosporangium sp. NBC_01495]|uniref:HNH endonuclease n=1 Tax=Streptosporangium sp. NBC_01495 TaxID=2903899 RepID=UPI003FCD3402